MKKLIVTSFVFLVAACHINYANYHVPAGYQTCNTTWDCPRGTYCGFVEVDSYAVCRH